ncbi:hypothetical protein ABC255_27175 [Neobacillus sp. 3P2-tot-E-2]|jgi:hypothetical protein|nr:hypothetical protein [Neobacillus niacini]MDF2787115.1 hypothetical protein [Neobacillus sp.]MDQ0973898.1 hypothetical protein [Neobacillus niacini]
MKKAIENFMDTYGKYIVASTFAQKQWTKNELEYVVSLFRDDSQR